MVGHSQTIPHLSGSSRTENLLSRMSTNSQGGDNSIHGSIEQKDRFSLHSPRSMDRTNRISLHSPGLIDRTDRVSLHSPESIDRTDRLSLHSSRSIDRTDRLSLHSPESIDRTDRLSLHSPRSIDRTDRLSLHSPGSIDRTDRLSLHSPGSIDRTDRLPLHSPGSIDRTDRLSLHSPGSIDRTDRFPPQSPNSDSEKTNRKSPLTSFTPFGSSNGRHYLHGSIPIMSPTASLPAALGLPAAWLQYSLYPPPTSLAGSTRPLSLVEYHQQFKQASMPTDLSYFKYKTPLVNRNYLELAMLVCNTFRGKLFPCSHCRYVTDRRNNLKRHISTMHQACDKVLECCGVTFSTKASLREHITIFHHNGYSCPFCGRRFCRKALLRRHLSVHNGQKDYNCPHCDYATSHKSNLERHKRIHDRLKINEPVPLLAHSNHISGRITNSNDGGFHSSDSDVDCTTINCDTESYNKLLDTTIIPPRNDFRENSPIPLITNRKTSCVSEKQKFPETISCDID